MIERFFEVLAILPAVVFGTVAVMWFRGDIDEGEPPEPWEW